MHIANRRFAKKLHLGGLAAAGAVLAAGCSQKAPVIVDLPPAVAPPVVVVPPRPYPPVGAPPDMVIPAVGGDGVRMTVNAHLTPTQTLWNFRSAYNVAALNCREPQHAEIVVGYRSFLKKHARALTAANRGVDAEFKEKHGARFIAPRETYMTQVYNYFANPVTLRAFCDASLEMSRAASIVEPANLETFSAAELPKLEQVFEAFFRAYEQYRMDAANWDAKYAPRPTVVTPGTGPAATPALTAYSPTTVQP
jgi:hypothetical protein